MGCPTQLLDLQSKYLVLLMYLMGLLTAVCLIFALLRWVYKHLLTPRANLLQKYAGPDGSAWAVVTGATSGIGLGFSEKLAERGFNLVIVSRSEEKLSNLRQTLKQSFPEIEVEYVAADFDGTDTLSKVESVVSLCSGKDVALLVNNVGVGFEYPKEITSLKAEEVDQIIEVNCRVSSHLTRCLLPQMKSRTGGGRRGGVINMSSSSSLEGSPLLSIYAASKAFNSAFSLALSAELEPFDIDVCSFRPFLVVSNLSKARPGLTVPTPDYFAEMALRQLNAGYLESMGTAVHSLMGGLLRCLPLSTMHSLVRKFHQDIQRRAIKKREREAARTKKKE